MTTYRLPQFKNQVYLDNEKYSCVEIILNSPVTQNHSRYDRPSIPVNIPEALLFSFVVPGKSRSALFAGYLFKRSYALGIALLQCDKNAYCNCPHLDRHFQLEITIIIYNY